MDRGSGRRTTDAAVPPAAGMTKTQVVLTRAGSWVGICCTEGKG